MLPSLRVNRVEAVPIPIAAANLRTPNIRFADHSVRVPKAKRSIDRPRATTPTH
jgi:hypothetical protein